MEKHLAQLNTLPTITEGLSKKQIADLADESVGHVLEEGNVFQVAEALAAMEEFVKSVRKDERYIQFLRDELAKHHGRLVTASGAKIEMCEAGVSYDYSSNAEWRELEAERFEIERRKRALEEKLRGRPGAEESLSRQLDLHLEEENTVPGSP